MPRTSAGSLWRHAFQAVVALVVAWFVLAPSTAHAGSPYLVIPTPQEAESTPAYRYANMTNEQAFAELDRRKVLYARVGPTGDVRAPIRLVSRLHGVYFHGALPPEKRATSMFEILDARMALALDDFAVVLEKHDIDEVVHYTMYRPNVAPPGARKKGDKKSRKGDKRPKKANKKAHKKADKKAGKPKSRKPKASPKKASPKKATPKKRDKAKKPAKRRRGASLESRDEQGETFFASTLAKKGPNKKKASKPRRRHKSTGKTSAVKPKGSHAHRRKHSKRAGPPPKRTSWAPLGTRHPGGLAIDVGGMKKKDGTWLSVANHFQGKLGSQTCGAGAPVPKSPQARELRAIACECLDAGVFTYVLTPNFDAAHVDHYHMEIKPGVKWFLYH